MLDIADHPISKYGTAFDLVGLANTVRVATIALHAFARSSAMVRLRHLRRGRGLTRCQLDLS